MKIVFVLPCSGKDPLGGLKVIYEHSNHFARRGYEVSIVHSAFERIDTPPNEWVKRALHFLRMCVTRNYKPGSWFTVDPKVALLWAPTLSQRFIPDADAVVATTWETAEWVARYPSNKGKKYYFVQEYERYAAASGEIKARMEETYRLGLCMTYISPVVRDMITDCGGSASLYLPNGIDFDVYYKTEDISSPDREMIGFPFREAAVKGTDDAIAALESLRIRHPHMKIWSFGTELKRPVPDWIEYHVSPKDEELRVLYNKTKIFIVPSHYEGWGLPGSEAMACGCALVTTDNGGCRAYAEDRVSAIFVQPRMPGRIAQAVEELIENEATRIRLAKAGYERIQEFTWDRSVAIFAAALSNPSHSPGI